MPSFSFWHRGGDGVEIGDAGASATTRDADVDDEESPPELTTTASFRDGVDPLNASVRIVDTNPEHLRLRYAVLDNPSLAFSALLGFQQVLTMLGATVSIIFITAPALGATRADTARLVSSIFFASGLITLLQTFFGDRLPIIQGGSFAFIAPVLAIARDVQQRPGNTWKTADLIMRSVSDLGAAADASKGVIRDHARFLATIREVSGAVISSSLVVFLIAATGLLGLVLPYISPITVASNIAVVGLALYESGVPAASSCWSLSVPAAALLIFFSQYLRMVSVPRLGRIFEVIPVIFTLAVVWPAAAIATRAGAFGPAEALRKSRDGTSDAAAIPASVLNCRVDVAEDGLLSKTPWFAVPPYPGQWGAPTFTWSSFFVMLGGSLAAMVESLGDYYAAARICGAPVPPPSAVSRGVMFQGIGCAIAGAFGTGSGTTAYNENLAAMQITRVGSRRVARAAGLWLLALSAVTPKFGAVLASVPQPLVAGLFCVLFGLIAATGISIFQHADQNSSRNILILGVSIFIGLSTPSFANEQRFAKQGGPVATSSAAVNSALNGLLKSGATVALLLSLFLDNTIPASHPEERGLGAWHAGKDTLERWWEDEALARVYALPFGISSRYGEARLKVLGKIKSFVSGNALGNMFSRRRKSDGDDKRGGKEKQKRSKKTATGAGAV